jgi:amidase
MKSASIRVLCAIALTLPIPGRVEAQFRVEEATIGSVHAAFADGTLTCRALVDAYLRRIEAFDRNGPALNAIVVVNPRVRAEADSMDLRYRAGGPVGPLHCVPVIVKDNFETAGLQTTAGSLALEGFIPEADAFQVRRIREAGGLVLAKSNMAELAFSPVETVSSILPGYTRNPYALDRVTAGSSGGTAAAVAANLGLVGLGSDTGNSIRGPAAHQALVGIRSTMGLTSRAGVVPLNLRADIAGPITRTVEDAVLLLQAIAGEDPDDPVTTAARGRVDPEYAAALIPDGLRGARIGILREAYERDSLDRDVAGVFEVALADLRLAGAEVVDVRIEGLNEIRRPEGVGPCMGFRYDIDQYLASRGGRAPIGSLQEILDSRRFHPSVELRIRNAAQGPAHGPESAECAADEAYREQVRAAVLAAMGAHGLDAFVHPTWSNIPRLIGDLNTPGGDNSQFFSPTTGFPAINVPMGFVRGVHPAGMTFFGRAWDEATLIRYAYAYEQATRHRRPPANAPPLR